jgi:hypothetical protein
MSTYWLVALSYPRLKSLAYSSVSLPTMTEPSRPLWLMPAVSPPSSVLLRSLLSMLLRRRALPLPVVVSEQATMQRRALEVILQGEMVRGLEHAAAHTAHTMGGGMF